MADIPHYFEYVAGNGERSKTHPFQYVKEERVFKIGATIISVAEFDPYDFNPYALSMDYEGIPVDEMPEHPALMQSSGELIGGPKLHDWIKGNQAEVGDIYKAMVDVFKIFVTNLPRESTRPSGSHMGFGSGITEYGDLRLQVFGNCACLGAIPHSYIIENKYEAGFAEYELHNDDTQAQRVSLYAGFGHIARLATDVAPKPV